VDAADEKILLNLSSERLTDSPEVIAANLRAALPGVDQFCCRIAAPINLNCSDQATCLIWPAGPIFASVIFRFFKSTGFD